MGELLVSAASYLTWLQIFVVLVTGFVVGYFILFNLENKFILEAIVVGFYLLVTALRFIEGAPNWERVLSSLMLWLVFSLGISMGTETR